MMHSFKLLFALAAGVAILPAVSHAESAKPEAASSKSESASGDKKAQAGNDDFEENRRTHMQKSKENNANKGAN